MPIVVRRRKGESISAFLYRFSKRIRQSGILQEAKKRMYHQRKPNKNKRKAMALYRLKKQKEYEKMKKMGQLL